MAPSPLLPLAEDPATTPFDYIVVGSGAGGGPLAARLALGGKHVLLLEAGIDPDGPSSRSGPPTSIADREVYRIPGYHPAATEDADLSWQYSVRHYTNDAQQARDHKYDPRRDPSTTGGVGKGGVQYPRSSALGGCTAHHAMIIVKPDAGDWNRIAATTGDDSWRAESMQGYFARVERCLYYTAFQGFFRKLFGFLYNAKRRLLTFINPRYALDSGNHGFAGWQPTSFIDPALVVGIAWRDLTFLRILFKVIVHLLFAGGLRKALRRLRASFRLVQFLDPNFGDTRSVTDPTLALIPIGTDGKSRTGLREHILETAQKHPDRLVVHTGVHVTRVVFAATAAGGPPRAIGVEACEAVHLYEPSPLRKPDPGARVQFFAKREVILCGGAFNTPQLLMLSGIGDANHLSGLKIQGPRDAADRPISGIVDLPGVGMNLQDRYEVSVVSEAHRELSTLKDVTFIPGSVNDPALLEWRKNRTGLYSTNGGALAIFLSSKRARFKPEPDLFVFGVPAAFRGYYWGWSRELLARVKGDPNVARNLWTWVILKAHTQNNGVVRLRSNSPFDQPDIDFRSFQPGSSAQDLAALAEGVAWVRKLNGTIGPFKAPRGSEIQPGAAIADGSPQLDAWIRDEAWGHHACGTCRMGSDRWVAQPSALVDKHAVLDSEFRVHGVEGLRVVDASIFPQIPGYFIVTPIFMAAEKAADVLLAASRDYPDELRRAEARAVAERRRVASVGAAAPGAVDVPLPADAVGLALSGGGIRSATFCLGVLQALAAAKRISKIDFLSTVSGGGYIGAFLGRLFTRLSSQVADKPARVEDTLTRSNSAEIWWLRSHANYLAGEGRSDLTSNIGAIWRNLLAIHTCIGALLVMLFATLRWLADNALEPWSNDTLLGSTLSPWWWAPLAIVFLGLVPALLGYWIAPRAGVARDIPSGAIYVWIAAILAAIGGLLVRGFEIYATGLIAVLLLPWPWQEASRLRIPADVPPIQRGAIARNRLTRATGSILFVLVLVIGWVVIDSLARAAAQMQLLMPTAAGMGLVAGSLPLLRSFASKLTTHRAVGTGIVPRNLLAPVTAGTLALVLTAFLLFGLDVIVHTVFDSNRALGLWLLAAALAVSVVLGRALGFLNASSLQALYSARLSRAFLGAANSDRVHAAATSGGAAVQAVHTDDDVAFHRYHPENNGGPLHLVNVCINETVDAVSGRALRRDKGLSMCVGPAGASVGRRFHATWTPGASANEPPALQPINTASDPKAFHVLAQSSGAPVRAESLPLSRWISISGAAFGTGAGRDTSLPVSLLLGLFNVRLGYWWNSGVSAGNRPGRYPPSLLRRLRGLFASVFRTQTTIINEWLARFPGPSDAFWYLTDGGHFENTGVYELVRRRLPFIISVDGTLDREYRFDSVALLERRVSLDFNAEISWIDPSHARGTGATGWAAVDPAGEVPNWIRNWVDPDRLGSIKTIKSGSDNAAALARINYGSGAPTGWLLLIKATLTADLPLVVRSYSLKNPDFPNDSTYDQFMTDEQWESYRLLGATLGRAIK